MKIERGNTNSWRLSSIAIGEVFEYKDVLYLKTNELIDNRRTCVRLVDGYIDWFVEETFVSKVISKVVIE